MHHIIYINYIYGSIPVSDDVAIAVFGPNLNKFYVFLKHMIDFNLKNFHKKTKHHLYLKEPFTKIIIYS
jgi:hypothetical protein